MCGRFTLTAPNIQVVAETAQATVDLDDAASYRPRYNIAPTQRHWIVANTPRNRSVTPATWGWALEKGLLINLRLETLFEKEYYHRQLLNNRCIVPADGFFEWGGDKGSKVPHWFHAVDCSLLFFAGMYWERARERFFTILTTASEPPVSSLHDRMPVFVPRSSFALWWSAPELFLRAVPKTALQAHRVSPKVNNANIDDPGCIVPDSENNYPEPQFGLF